MKRSSLLAGVLFVGMTVLGPGLLLPKTSLGSGIAQAAEAKAEPEEEGHKSNKSDSAVKAFAAATAVGICAFATGFAQSKIGAAAMGTIAEKPEAAPMCIVLVALPETLVILGFVVGAMIVMF